MLGEVVAAHETAEAHGAGEPFLTGVGPTVARKLIGARESPLASFPLTFERFLTCVCPHVGLEVGALEVGLATVLVRANVAPRARHFSLRRGASLLYRCTPRCGGDGCKPGATGRRLRLLDVNGRNGRLGDEEHYGAIHHLTLY